MSGLVERMSVNPCRILGVEGGSLAVGKPADITIAEIDKEYAIDKKYICFQRKKYAVRWKKSVWKD